MRADKAPLLPLLPAMLSAKLGAHEVGKLDWNMDGDITLVKTNGKLALDTVALTGGLDVTGASIAIPKSKRRYSDVALHVTAEPAGVRIKSLELHEGARKLAISGLLALDKTKPKHLDLSLVAKDWLVFGGEKFGMPDAPHGEASFDIGVAVDLTQPVLGVDATIHSLALASPDRLDRGHYQEHASVSGDIIFVDGKHAGKLPYAAPIAVARKHVRPMDVRVHIPQPIRAQMPPLDVMTKGELTITVRDEGVKPRGTLTMTGGTLNLFGYDHQLVEGTVSFTDEHPKGWMELVFERELPAYAKRELSSSAGGARISLKGVPNQQKTVLSGSANGAMMEVMAMYNAGRPMNVTRPGQPASSTVQLPRGDQLFVLTFMASNLPHLLFLDRVTAWSEAAAPHVTNVEAEKYTRNARIRAVVRPQTPGRSENELQYDRLLINNDRSALGVGVRAGDRAGGGVGLFYEWSSKD